MSCKKGGKTKKHLLSAKLATEDCGACAFCSRTIDDETVCGKLYSIGDIQCHYFCVLLSCCLIQKGKDSEGLFGFLYPDIIAEIERSKKHRCSYCGREGATLGCSISQCRKQFHLPCGRERDAVSLFYGNYKSFCQLHAPRQKIDVEIMMKVKERALAQRKPKIPKEIVEKETESKENDINLKDKETHVLEIVCVICYEPVEASPTIKTFWPPCCARDAWFHRNCLQRMALSAGMHYLKCPLCNDKDIFLEAVMSQGYYVPDRDAAWELEQNAFSEIYERSVTCSAEDCTCPMGRDHDSDTDGSWDIKLCILCGSSGMHETCLLAKNGSNDLDGKNGKNGRRYVCVTCAPAAPQDIDALAATVEKVVIGEEPPQPVRRGPVMPCRMSLRRTKQRISYNSASSSNTPNVKLQTNPQEKEDTSNINKSRVNLKSPKKPFCNIIESNVLKEIDKNLLSPLKLLEKGLFERITEREIKNFELDSKKLLEIMSQKFKKPKPLVVKKKIINELLEIVLEDLKKDNTKKKESVREWNSPKKCIDVEKIQTGEDSFEEIFKGFDTVNEKSTEKMEKIIQTIEDTGKEDRIEENIQTLKTPKKLKHFHIQKDSSMEISEKEQTVNIDVVKMEGNDQNGDVIKDKCSKKDNEMKICSLKFKLNDKDELQTDTHDIDIESFKSHYLNEVDRDGKCGVNRKIVKTEEKPKKGVKRKIPVTESVAERKTRKLIENKKPEIEADTKNIKRTKKKIRDISIENKNLKVKIRWKHEHLKLQITDTSRRNTKKKKIVQNKKKLKQFVLKFSPEMSNRNIKRQEKDTVTVKRKNTKQAKGRDKLVQTSLYDFFKTETDKKTA